MRVHISSADVVRTGRAVDLTEYELDPGGIRAALGGETGVTQDTPSVTIDSPPPGAFHDVVGVIQPEMSVSRRAVLAATARTRGLSAPADDRIETLEAELSAIDPPAVATEPARRRVAAVGAEQERLRERVARLQGRVRERRAAGLEPGDLEDELAEAVRTLSEVETERVAARQALAAAREDARAARDVRDRKFRLEDTLANRRRDARAHLAAAVRDDVDAAVAAAPGDAKTVDRARSQTVALAAGRVASIAAPLVLVDPPFAETAAAASWLDVPVIEV